MVTGESTDLNVHDILEIAKDCDSKVRVLAGLALETRARLPPGKHLETLHEVFDAEKYQRVNLACRWSQNHLGTQQCGVNREYRLGRRKTFLDIL